MKPQQEKTAESTADAPSGFFLLRWGLTNELLKLFARPRTYIGFAVFLAFEVLILSLLRLPRPRREFQRLLEDNGFLFENYFSGLTLAVAMIASAVFFLGALYLALVAGDIVAKEAEDGTLRMILNRPVPRWHLLFYKWSACLVYTFLLMVFFGISSVLVGVLFQGWGGLFVFMPLQSVFAIFSPGEGLYRITLGMLMLGAMLCTVSSIGFLCSCLSIKPAAASILTLSFIYADFVLYNLPYFSDYQHFFLYHSISQWTLVFESPLSVYAMLRALLPLWAVNFSCFILSVVIFTRKDFKS